MVRLPDWSIFEGLAVATAFLGVSLLLDSYNPSPPPESFSMIRDSALAISASLTLIMAAQRY